MTKFILHGGFNRQPNELNQTYYREIVSNLKDDATILLIYFAAPEEKWMSYEAKHREFFLEQSEGKKCNFIIARAENLHEQLKVSDAVFLQGGETLKLLSTLRTDPGFAEVVKGKTIAGSSAGAYVLSRHYISADTGKVGEGLGILPIKVVCHFESSEFPDQKEPVKLLEPYSEELVVLKDFEWKVIEV